jgi:hypothetical protein
MLSLLLFLCAVELVPATNITEKIALFADDFKTSTVRAVRNNNQFEIIRNVAHDNLTTPDNRRIIHQIALATAKASNQRKILAWLIFLSPES